MKKIKIDRNEKVKGGSLLSENVKLSFKKTPRKNFLIL